MSAPVLIILDFEKEFVLITNASLVSVGAILQQDQGEGLQPVCYASKKLNPTETRYLAYERELLAIIWSVGLWRSYLDCLPFRIQSNHSFLRYLPNQSTTNRRVWKWISVLQSYDCSIEHIPGLKNPADSLSRRWGGEELVNVTAKEEDAEFVRLLRVGKDASDQDIQEALNRVFGKQEDKTGLPEDAKDMGHILLDDEVGEDSWFCPSHKSTTLAVTHSSVRVDRSIR